MTLGPAVKRVFCSVDWGFTNPGVMQVWALDSDVRMYRVHEEYMTQQLIGYWVERAKAIQKHFKPEVFVCDPSEPAYISEFRAAELHAIPAYNAVAHGIQAVQARLAPAGDGRPRLFLLRDSLVARDERLVEAKKPLCTEQEIDGYVWEKSADGKPIKEQPVKVDDHGVDCTRYAVAWADGLGRRKVTFV